MREKPDKIFKLVNAKVLFILLLYIAFFNSCSFGQSVTWQRSYLGSRFSAGYSIKQTSDGNYITCGSRFNYGGFIAKLNSNGDTLWVKYFPVTEMYSIVEANDGNYVGIGISSPLFIVKVEQNGNTVWSRFITEDNYDIYPYHISNTFDNSYVIAGRAETSFPSTSSGYYIKVDNNGNKLWSKLINSQSGRKNFLYINQMNDSNFILTGSINPLNTSQIYLVKAKPNGDTIWTKSYGNPLIYENGQTVFQTPDKGFFVIAQTYAEDPEKLLFCKTDSSGNLIWNKTYNSPNAHYGLFYGDGAVKIEYNSSYVLSGYKLNYPANDTLKTFLLNIDTAGDKIWERNFYNSFNESRGWSVDICNDSGFVISGQLYPRTTQNSQSSTNFVYFIKTNKVGEINPIGIINYSNEIPKEFNIYQNYPNPFNPYTNIKFDVSIAADIKINIYDINGQLLRILTDKFYKEGRYSLKADFNDLPSGIYFLQFTSDTGFRKSIKIVSIK